MKILHTADWHIGKQLYKHSLEDDLTMFFEWLEETIATEKIDILMVAGDIFDHSFPSTHSVATYYRLLTSMIGRKIQIIITGGNHDSVNHLHASRPILNMLNIRVVGGITENLMDEIIPLTDSNGKLEAILLAVPYLRDRDVRNFVSSQTESDRLADIKSGIVNHYQSVRDLAISTYGSNHPIIAMGHLYLQGAQSSDSEREIQVGNLAAVDADSLKGMFHYMALGHIHRPQSFLDGAIQYSGSPISLSFSEKDDLKRCVIIEINNGFVTTSSLPIPKFRSLKKLTGTLSQVKEALEIIEYKSSLDTFVEIAVHEKKYNPSSINDLNNLVTSLSRSDIQIVKHAISFEESPYRINNLYQSTYAINELTPRQVFLDRLSKDSISEEDLSLILEAFDEVFEKSLNKEA